jgi:hypothetical protein
MNNQEDNQDALTGAAIRWAAIVALLWTIGIIAWLIWTVTRS